MNPCPWLFLPVTAYVYLLSTQHSAGTNSCPGQMPDQPPGAAHGDAWAAGRRELLQSEGGDQK